MFQRRAAILSRRDMLIQQNIQRFARRLQFTTESPTVWFSITPYFADTAICSREVLLKQPKLGRAKFGGPEMLYTISDGTMQLPGGSQLYANTYAAISNAGQVFLATVHHMEHPSDPTKLAMSRIIREAEDVRIFAKQFYLSPDVTIPG